MNFIFSKISDFFFRRNNFQILKLGLPASGKTTILYRLINGKFIDLIPTIGFNIEELSYNNIKLRVWDLSGRETTRKMWEKYYYNTDAIIYVIDTFYEDYELSKYEFYNLLENNDLKNAIILIYANKQDLPGAKNIKDIIQIFDFYSIKSHLWHIQLCSAKTGEGLITGLKWLTDQLIFKCDNCAANPYNDKNKIKVNNQENINAYKLKNESRKNIINQLENENNNLKKSLKPKENKIQSLKLDEYYKKILQYEKEISILKEDKDNLSVKIKSLEKYINNNDNYIKNLKDEIIYLRAELKIKDNEIKELKEKNKFDLRKNEKLLSIIINSNDENIFHSFICKNTDKFSKIEKMFYNIYPDYKKMENNFYIKGNEEIIIDKSKTIEQNNIKESDIIILNNFEI